MSYVDETADAVLERLGVSRLEMKMLLSTLGVDVDVYDQREQDKPRFSFPVNGKDEEE